MSEGSRRFKDVPLDADDPAERAIASATPPLRRSIGGGANFMARQVEATNQSLQSEIENLRAQINGGKLLVKLDPKSITHSDYANRHELSLRPDDPELLRLKQSIQQYGQDRPIFVRPAPEGSSFKYELIEGHRRHAVCLMLDEELEGGFGINALIDAGVSGVRELVLQMQRENDDRYNLSPYEQGAAWKAWLSTGVFQSQMQIAEAVNKGESTVFKYIQIAELPPSVIAAFRDPRNISLRWGAELAKALKARPEAVEAEALRLQSIEGMSAEQVFRALVASALDARPASPSREETVKIGGKVAFRIARKDGRVSLRFAPSVSKSTQRELCDEIKDLVERALKGMKK